MVRGVWIDFVLIVFFYIWDMKKLFCLIILIGMIGFTGFATTGDLTKNSDIAYMVDNDVGDVWAIVVDDLVLVEYESLFDGVPYLDLGGDFIFVTSFHPDSGDFNKYSLSQLHFIETSIELRLCAYRLARDGFRS